MEKKLYLPYTAIICQRTPCGRLSTEESRCVGVVGEEVRVRRAVVSENSMFIPPWGEGCQCWILVNELWWLIPVSWIIQQYGTVVFAADTSTDTSTIVLRIHWWSGLPQWATNTRSRICEQGLFRNSVQGGRGMNVSLERFISILMMFLLNVFVVDS